MVVCEVYRVNFANRMWEGVRKKGKGHGNGYTPPTTRPTLGRIGGPIPAHREMSRSPRARYGISINNSPAFKLLIDQNRKPNRT